MSLLGLSSACFYDQCEECMDAYCACGCHDEPDDFEYTEYDSCPECTELSLTPQRPELTTTVHDVRQPTVRPQYQDEADA